jgi:hypothetical protein
VQAPVVPLGVHVHVAFPPMHTTPHPPQSLGFVASSTQAPLHRLRPPPQTQWPPLHAAPMGHAFPQPPQFPLSFDVLTQVPPHRASEPPHTHVPPLHVVAAGHTFPHTPQLDGSVVLSMHAPLATH